MAIQSAVVSASTAHRPHVFTIPIQIPWLRILEIGESAATAVGLKGVYRDDCAMDFVVSMTAAQEGSENLSEEALQEHAGKFARSVATRLKRDIRRFRSLDEPAEDGKANAAREHASRDLGPDDLLQSVDFLQRMLAPLEEFSSTQRRLFISRVVHEKRLVDLAEETGRSANALAQSISNMLRRMRDMLKESGIDREEITDRLSQHDRMHAM